MRKTKAEAIEPIAQAGRGRAISLAGGQDPMTWKGVLEQPRGGVADPQAAMATPTAPAPRARQPFELFPDMPEGHAARAADMTTVEMPPLDTLRHDAEFFGALKRSKAPILDGLLDGLRDYYR